MQEVRKTLSELTQQFMFVHKCWQDHKMAVKHNMTVERAIRDLREVQDQALKVVHGTRLSWRAHILLNDIVHVPMEFDSSGARTAR